MGTLQIIGIIATVVVITLLFVTDVIVKDDYE